MNPALFINIKISMRIVLGIFDQHQVRQPTLTVQGLESGKIKIRPHVCVDHNKAVILEFRQRFDDSACCFEANRLTGVADLDSQSGTVPQMLLNHAAQIEVVDHHAGHAAGLEALNLMLNQGLAPHLQQGFGDISGERLHAFA